jgi:hypothetical protein
MSTPPSIQTIVGKRPWKVWKGFGSFLLFEFGRKQKRPTGATHGAFCLWIYMAHWRIKKSGEEIAHSESSDEGIAKAASALCGKRLEAAILSSVVTKGQVRHAARFEFEGDLSVQTFMYDDHELDSIFLLYTPAGLLSYGYDGSLTFQKMKKEPTVQRTGASRLAQRPTRTSSAAGSRR